MNLLLWVKKQLCVLIPLVVGAAFLAFIGPSASYINPSYKFSSWILMMQNNQTTIDTTVEKEEHAMITTAVHHSGNFSNSSHGFIINSSSNPVERGERGEIDVKGRNPPSKENRRRRRNLEFVERDLAEARAAILTATKPGNITNDPDYVPDGSIYLNPKPFHRSYLEMEKRLKVYVYEDGDPPVFHYGPCKHTYSIEGIFMSNMEVSGFRTYDPHEAHLFFIPLSITMIAQTIYEPDSHDWTLMKDTALDYVNLIARKYPFWNRTRGADHFMLACHDWGPEISFAVPNLHNNSIRALCNANTSERFDPSRDVSVPEIHIPGDSIKGLIGGPRPSQRKILVFYAGGVHGPVRPILLNHWENKSDPEMRIHRYLPKSVSYYDMMRKSKYCLCPSGYEVASPRMVEGVYMGCVPVLIKEGYVEPFSDVLNWGEFAVTVGVAQIPDLKRILSGISLRRYVRMQRAGIQVRRHFMVNARPKRYDVFHMILHSIWLRRMNVVLHEYETWDAGSR